MFGRSRRFCAFKLMVSQISLVNITISVIAVPMTSLFAKGPRISD